MSNKERKKVVFNNRIVDKGQLKKLISWSFKNHGTTRTAQVADDLKGLGFRYATKAGVSIGIDDLQVPPIKREMLKQAEDTIKNTEDRYTRGEITEVERFQKVIDTWNQTSEELKDKVVENFRENYPLNSVYMMAFSGARGNLSQVRQLVGMRGLMSNPQGEIIDLPIKTNFREGLTVTEYIISSYGARKGLVDTALRTADSGYLTRRLVDVAQDTIVRENDCQTLRGLTIGAMKDGDRVLIPLHKRLYGRLLAADALDPQTGEVVATRNQELDEETIAKIVSANIEEVQVRSPLTCEAVRSVCQCCYGWSLAHGHMVDLGEAVGIVAAQSIGEPGTQLTMRTFHTGGVFTGEVEQQIRAPFDGILRWGSVKTRPVRTRHGDDREQVESNGELTIEPKGKGKKQVFSVSAGSLLMVGDGQDVTHGDLIAELASAKGRRPTEKATKDVATDIQGEVYFDGFSPEDRTDRQGNTTRIAQRGGLIWVAAGEVYNLLPGAEPVVTNGDIIEENGVIAETKLISVNGGTVRLRGEREIDIITASVKLDEAEVTVESSGSRDRYIITTGKQKFQLLVPPGTKVPNQTPVAELIDDSYRTRTGGIVKYIDIDVQKKAKPKQGYEVIKGGTIFWIPEETHEVNKDASLLLVEEGQYVEAGTAVVKDIICNSSGVVEIVQKNDILREITIKPGELHLLDDPEAGQSVTDTFVYPGQKPIPELPEVSEVRYLEYVETPEGSALLMRPAVEYQVSDTPSVPSQTSIDEREQGIALRAIQRLTFKDGERVKSVDGVELLRTQLVLEMAQEGITAPQMTADIELVDDGDCQRLQLAILESLTIRRDNTGDSLGGLTHTEPLVKDGDTILPGAVVARTEIRCKHAGEIRGIRKGNEIVRRVLLVRSADRVSIPLKGAKAKYPVGQFVIAGAELAPGIKSTESGQIVAIEDDNIIMRRARPYRVSPGAVLHVEAGDLVQRGDNLVLLVFERAKTGDIIQGLPRIEELLEARKPKEGCILNRRSGTIALTYSEDGDPSEIKVIEAGGLVSEYPLLPGQNAIVSDGQFVEAGQPITDGQPNPHEILEVYFTWNRDELGDYQAAMIALKEAQSFFVNEVQSVYQSQGIDIADKHIEVIVRQMTSKVRIEDGGETILLPGELIELREAEESNKTMAITGQAPAKYIPVLLGITKASLNTDSFISAASFQETTRVLTEAAIEGKSDWLRGLKENVIIGRLIPAGTGFNAYDEFAERGAYEDTSNFYYDPAFGMDNDDAIIDDRTARHYDIEERPGFSLFTPGKEEEEDEEESMAVGGMHPFLRSPIDDDDEAYAGDDDDGGEEDGGDDFDDDFDDE